MLDLRIDVRPGQTPLQGLFVRLIVPSALPARTDAHRSGPVAPALVQFPGTGTCFLEVPAANLSCSCSLDSPCTLATGCLPYQLAQDGVLIVQFGERGSSHCYAPEDVMTSTATWVGQTEFDDYDYVLGLLISAGLHASLPRVDGARLGLSGSSHGGIESLLYASGSSAFSKFALVMADVGTPSLWTSWGAWTFDPLAVE